MTAEVLTCPLQRRQPRGVHRTAGERQAAGPLENLQNGLMRLGAVQSGATRRNSPRVFVAVRCVTAAERLA